MRTDATGMAVTLTVTVADTASIVAVISALPARSPVTRPFGDTVAMLASPARHAVARFASAAPPASTAIAWS